MRAYKILLSSLFSIVTLLFIGFHLNVAQAAVGDIQITVTDEIGAPVPGATVLVQCTGGAYTTLTGSPVTSIVGLVLAAPQAGSSCDNGDTVNIRATSSGYVTLTVAPAGTYLSAANPNVYIASSMLYPLKVLVSDEIGNPWSPLNPPGPVPTLNGSDPSAYTTNTAYWTGNSISAATLLVQREGYVDSTTTNPGMTVSTNSSAQVLITLTGQGSACTSNVSVSTTCKGMQYASKLTVTGPSSSSLSGLTVKAGNGLTISCPENGSTGIYYCVIPVSDTNSQISVAVGSTPIVNVPYSDRTLSSDAQSNLSTSISTTGGGGPQLINGVDPSQVNSSVNANNTQNQTPVTVTPVVSVETEKPSVSVVSSNPDASITIIPVSAVPFKVDFLTKDVTSKSSATMIKNLQKALNKALGGQLSEDGKWGPKTTKAVKDFQVWANIKVDGKVGPITREKINQAIK